MILLLISLCKDRHLLGDVVKAFHSSAKQKMPWWIWLGGILGALFIYGSTVLVPLVGTATTVILVLCGTISASLAIDHFALFGAIKRPVRLKQLLGLALLIAGVVLVHWY